MAPASLGRPSDLRRLLTRLALVASAAPSACTTEPGRSPPAGLDDTDRDTLVGDTEPLPIDTVVVDETDPVEETDDTDPVGDTDSDPVVLPDTGDTDPDSDPSDSDTDTDPPDTAPTTVGVDQLQAGDLVITEAQVDPWSCARGAGQYLELKNRLDQPVNLRGLRLKIATQTTTVSPTADLIVAPGAYAVAETATQSCPYSAALVSSFTFPSSSVIPVAGTVVELRSPLGTTIDRVDFARIRLGTASAVAPRGHAVSLSGPETAVANDVAANWCAEDTLLPGATADFGTPFAPAGCSAFVPDTDTDTDDTSTTDTDVPDPDEPPPGVTPTPLWQAPSDALVITEVMLASGCGDESQYVELRNTTASWLDLSSLRISVDGRSFSAGYGPRRPVAPGGYALVERYSVSPCAFAASLHEHARFDPYAALLPDSVLQVGTWGRPMDTVDLGRLPVDPVDSRAVHLTGPEDVTSNDDPAAWCLADTPLPGSPPAYGTPFARATTCLPDDTDGHDTDTDVPEPLPGPWTSPTCSGWAWNPLSNLATPTPHAHLLAVWPNTLDSGWWDSSAPSVRELDEIGARCADAADPAACEVALDAELEAQSDRTIASTDGGVVALWAGPAEVLTLLGDVDTLDEALLRLWTLGYPISCSSTIGRQVDGGWEVTTEITTEICPLTYADLHLRVAVDGTKTSLGSTPSLDTGGGCVGRRPPGLVDGAAPATLGALLARHAGLEAASVVAFDHLHTELVALGAPADLLRRVRAAARDEVRHAKQVGALARRYGAEPEAPCVAPTPLRDPLAIALDNAVEGCVGETWGALVGTWQADHAGDAHVAATMRRVARDEVRHAALSWALDEWLHDRLDEAGRAAVAAAKRDALDRLRARAARPVDRYRVVNLGQPDADAATRLADGLADAFAA